MFIFLRSDPFSRKEIDESLGTLRGAASVPTSVRRPYRGIQIKDDTYASISIIRAGDGGAIPLLSSSARNTGVNGGKGEVSEYTDFILTDVSESRQEKVQILETFGEPFVYLFGQRPVTATFNGVLVNTEDFNWRAQFWENYENNLRGTKLVENNARAYIAYDTIVVGGYVLSASASEASMQPYTVNFRFDLLVTDRYDYSNIGSVEFPPAEHKDLKVANQELLNNRQKFSSTGADVRLRNLLAGGSSGLLSTLRSGVRAFNDAVGFVGGVSDSLHNVVGGRNVRLPIGVAGYLASTGDIQVASGSVGSLLESEGLGEQFNAATGQYEGVKGSVKIKAPGSAKFATPWTSKYKTGSPRGYIFENVDEYPFFQDPKNVSDIVPKSEQAKIKQRVTERQQAAKAQSVKLVEWNLLAEAGGLLGDLSEGVAFAKSNFGMVMSAAAFVADPESSVKASLGIGVGTTSKSRVAGRADDLERRGISVKGPSSEASKYIGVSALNTFSAQANNIADGLTFTDSDPQPELGKTYTSSPYSTSEGEEVDYELVYGGNDYTPLVERDPSAKATLDSVYGNNDSISENPDVTKEQLEEVYGGGSSAESVRSRSEVLSRMRQYSAEKQRLEKSDTEGIRGVGEDDNVIEPSV